MLSDSVSRIVPLASTKLVLTSTSSASSVCEGFLSTTPYEVQASGEGATAVAADLEAALQQIVDEGWNWKHTDEGDRNPWAHVRAALTASSVTIPLEDGELALGDLQAIFFCEFDGPRERKIYVTVT
jgi:secondary thiamine-phosphate synthase enzyme